MLLCLTGLIALVVGGAACVTSRSAGAFGSGLPTIPASEDILDLEHKMFVRVNQDRSRAGLPPLQYDERLAAIARYHSHDMKTAGFFGHESPHTGNVQQRLDRAGYVAAEGRENVAEAGDVATAQDSLLKSPGHRANLLAVSITHIGIGIVRSDQRGLPVLLVTQVFARPVQDVSPEQAVQVIERNIVDARRSAGLSPLAVDAQLRRLAQEYAGQIPDDLSETALQDIGNRVLAAAGGVGARGLEVSAVLVIGPEEYTPKGSALSPGGRAYGLGIASGRSAEGRPMWKVLLLVAS